MSGTISTLDDAFALLDWLSRQSDAFTTGTPANATLTGWTTALLATIQAAETTAETAIGAATLRSPAGVLAAVSAAGNAACSRAALAELLNLQTVLARQ